MRGHEVLVVGILDVTDDNTASSNQGVVLGAWVKVHAIGDLSTVPNGMIKFNLLLF